MFTLRANEATRLIQHPREDDAERAGMSTAGSGTTCTGVGATSDLDVSSAGISRKSSSSSSTSKIFICSAIILGVALLSAFTSKTTGTGTGMHSDISSLADLFHMHEVHTRAFKKKKKDDDDYDCKHDESYSKTTLKLAYELPFVALFQNTKHEKKFEASSIIIVNDTYYAICDNSWAISKFTSSLTPFSNDNIMIGDPNREEDEESGYEVIFYNNSTFYVIRESVKHEGADKDEAEYHAIVEELILNDAGDDYEIKDQCSCEFEFEGTSKGFEGGFGMEGTDGEFYIVGLCEGNHCSEKKKDDKGHGRMVLMKKKDCLWITVKQINIPKTASFTDYSDMSIQEKNGMVAITSQEDSALWIGQMVGIVNGKLDPGILGFDEDVYDVYHFPKSDTCKTKYCNIEGIAFINDDMIMAVSDKMKGKGKQSYRCLDKDQSIHAFALPYV